MDFPADYHEDTQELRNTRDFDANRTSTLPPSEAVSAPYSEPADHSTQQYARPQSDFVETNPHTYYNNNASNYNNDTTVPAAGYAPQPQYPVEHQQQSYPAEKSYPTEKRQDSYYSNRESQPVAPQSNRMSLNPHENASHRNSYVDSGSNSGLPDPIPVKF